MKKINSLIDRFKEKRNSKATSLKIPFMPGMRVNKSVLALFLCWVIASLRENGDFIDAPMAAVIAMQTSVESSLKEGMLRVLGTLLAGIYTVIVIELLVGAFKLDPKRIIFLALSSLLLLPFIFFLLAARLHKAISNAIIVFIIIIANTSHDLDASAIFAVNRVFNTAIGVAVATFVNWLPILNKRSVQISEDLAEKKDPNQAK